MDRASWTIFMAYRPFQFFAVPGLACCLAGGFLYLRFLYFFFRLMIYTDDSMLRREYRRRVFRAVRARPREPVIYFYYVLKCAMHYHHYTMARNMATDPDQVVSTFGTPRSRSPQMATAAASSAAASSASA